MSYIEDTLLSNEKIVARATPSLIVFAPVLILAGIGVLLNVAIMIPLALNSHGGGMGVGGRFLCLSPYCLFVFIVTAQKAASYFSTEIAVTNHRIIGKTGLVRQRSLDIMLKQMEGVSIQQGAMGRLFGYGSVVVSGSGGTKQVFPDIADPATFRKKVNQAGSDTGATDTKRPP